MVVIGCAGAKGTGAGVASSGAPGQANCGTPTCPVGTYHDNSGSSHTGTELGVNFDPAKFSGGIAFKTFGDGACKYTCVTIQACAEKTIPVITETCFTCGVLQGEKIVSACQSGGAAPAPALQPASAGK